MKKGIALLITIGFLITLTTLIAYMFSISQKSFDQVNKVEAKNQSAIMFADVKTILDSYAKKLKDSNDLDTFLLGTPPFYDEKSGLSLHVSLQPLSNKININSILIKKKVDKHIELFIRNICETYNILDPAFLVSLILDTIDEDDISRQALSEISRENIKFSNTKIVNLKHFKTIINYYAKTTQDNNILKVPWDRLLYFGQSQKTTLDCDRLSKELVNALRLDTQVFSGCDSLQDKQSKIIAKNYLLKPFSKKDNYYVLVNIEYIIEDKESSISFDYDIKTNN